MVKYIQNENCPYRLVDEHVFVLEPINSNFIKLNKTGSVIWMLIETAKTKEDIFKDLQNIFDINEQNETQIRGEIDAFLNMLMAKNLIISKSE